MTMTPKKPPKPRKRIWHLVTNHQNMLYMLAADMVMSPAGFRGKHYSDPLDLYPGWIPLFWNRAKIPDAAIKHATAERKHLLPCIASFDLKDLSGPVRILRRDGSTRDVTLPIARKNKNDIAILIRAPLPMTPLSVIRFRSSDDKQSFERAAHDVSNVDLVSRKLSVLRPLFDTDMHVGSPSVQAQESLLKDRDDHFPAFGQALGGALAMLYHIANRSDLGLAVFRLVTEEMCHEDANVLQSDPVLAELLSWMTKGEVSAQADIRAQLFWGVVQSLVKAQSEKRQQTPVDIALEYLESQLNHLRETQFEPRLERLIADMRGCLGLGGGTITELLDRHKGSLSRPLLLFCLRESCTDLLEFSHPLLNDAEYILAGILFGVRDSWLQFPKGLRHPDMSAYVAYKMADAEHRNHGDGLSLNPPTRPKPLREFFVSSGGTWTSQQRDAVLKLVRKYKWNDCIQTRITLAEGDYPDRFERNGLQIIVPGRVNKSNIIEEFDVKGFLHRLGQCPPIEPKIETEIRSKIKK